MPFGDLGLGRDDPARLPEEAANGVTDGCHLADGFGQDVTDAFQDLLVRFEGFLGIDEFLRRGREIGKRLVASPNAERQRLEALFAGFGGFAALFRLEWEVQILESLGMVGRTNGGGQIGGEFPLALDRLEDRLFSLGKLTQALNAKLDLADHNFVQVAGGFFAVAGDEGNGVPHVQELNDALDLRAPILQVLRDATQVHLNRVAHVDSTRHLVRQSGSDVSDRSRHRCQRISPHR